MNKINKIFLIVVVILLLVLVGIVSWQLWGGESRFYAVYLVTGDLYFGKLTKFPSYGLKQAYMLQINPQDPDNPLSIQRFRDVFWGPHDYIKINRSHVVWAAKLDQGGQLAELLRTNPDLIPQAGVPGDAGTGQEFPGFVPDLTPEE